MARSVRECAHQRGYKAWQGPPRALRSGKIGAGSRPFFSGRVRTSMPDTAVPTDQAPRELASITPAAPAI
jgi:hypothetical protein